MTQQALHQGHLPSAVLPIPSRGTHTAQQAAPPFPVPAKEVLYSSADPAGSPRCPWVQQQAVLREERGETPRPNSGVALGTGRGQSHKYSTRVQHYAAPM